MQQYWGIWSDIALMALVLAVGSVWLQIQRFARERANVYDIGCRERLDWIERIVEQSAIEIERIAEGQRYTAKMLAQRESPTFPERDAGRVITPH